MGFFSNLFKSKKSGSIIGLDIGSSSLKVVQLRRKGGTAVLETYGELALGPYAKGEVGQATNLPADKIAETLRDLMREANVTTTDSGVSIPFARSLLTLVEMPRKENQEEIKTMVELEARKYIPVPVSEVQFDWFVLPDMVAEGQAPPPQMKVLIVAVHNDQLALLQSVVAGAALTASFYEIEIFSTIRSCVDDMVNPVMVLDIGASATKTYVVEHGVVALSHNIPQGGQDVTRTIASAHGKTFPEAESLKKQYGLSPAQGTYDKKTIELVFSNIFQEAKRAQAQYEMVQKKPIKSIVLTGGGAVTKDLGAFARNFFSVEVKVANPFAHTEAPEFMRPVLQEIGPEFAVAVGIALRKLED